MYVRLRPWGGTRSQTVVRREEAREEHELGSQKNHHAENQGMRACLDTFGGKQASYENRIVGYSCNAMLPTGDTMQAHHLHDVWMIFTWCGVFVYAVTGGLVLWAVFRYRRTRLGKTRAALPAFFRNNPPLEITYTLISLAMLCGLFATTYAAEHHVEELASSPALTANVTGFRWSWRFDYPTQRISVSGTPQRPPQLVLPLDVNHAFWVPAFLFKRDALPGYVNHFDLTPSVLGVKPGECVEFCGLEHARMFFSVNIVSSREFAAWVRRASHG